MILACRDEENANEAAKDIISETGSDKVIVRIVDLASFDSVRAFAKLINETEDRLDILVNNAALGAAPYQVTEDGYESIFQVNYLSQFLLTLLLLEKIKKSAPSRIVNVSSYAHTFPNITVQLQDFKPTKEEFNSVTRYGESKLALVMFTSSTGIPGLNSAGIFAGIPPVFRRNYCRHSPRYSTGIIAGIPPVFHRNSAGIIAVIPPAFHQNYGPEFCWNYCQHFPGILGWNSTELLPAFSWYSTGILG